MYPSTKFVRISFQSRDVGFRHTLTTDVKAHFYSNAFPSLCTVSMVFLNAFLRRVIVFVCSNEFNVRQRCKAMWTIGQSLSFTPTNRLGFTVLNLPPKSTSTHPSTNQDRRELSSKNDQGFWSPP